MIWIFSVLEIVIYFLFNDTLNTLLNDLILSVLEIVIYFLFNDTLNTLLNDLDFFSFRNCNIFLLGVLLVLKITEQNPSGSPTGIDLRAITHQAGIYTTELLMYHIFKGRKEMFLFNNILNTFYLLLKGIKIL